MLLETFVDVSRTPPTGLTGSALCSMTATRLFHILRTNTLSQHLESQKTYLRCETLEALLATLSLQFRNKLLFYITPKRGFMIC